MKKLTSGILLLIFMFYSGGYYLWYISQQHAIRHGVRNKIKAGLNKEDLTLITIPLKDESEIRWIKPDKEFKYRGELFDVVSIRIVGQEKLIYCFNDKKEKQLITEFHRQQQREKKSDNNVRRILNQLFYSSESFQITFFNSGDFCFAPVIFYYKSNFPDILSPPPNFA